MKILFFSNDFPRPWEPLRAVFNLGLVQNLAARHEVRVVCPVAWTERRGEGPALPVAASYPRYFFPPKIAPGQWGRCMWWSLRRKLLAELRAFKPDLILAYWTHPDGEVALRLARKLGLPMVQIVGGSDVLIMAKQPARRSRIAAVLSEADQVITMGRHLGGAVQALGARAERIATLYRPVNTAVFKPGDRASARKKLGLDASRPMVLWIGRFEPVKGLGTLVAAAEGLCKQFPKALLCLIGEGSERSKLEAKVREKGLGENFQFVGGIAHKALADWFHAANAVVLPSLSEGVPNVLLEAIACGIPFVASKVGGIPEIAGEGDRLVPVGDADALASALAATLTGAPGALTGERVCASSEHFAAAIDGLLQSTVAHFHAEKAAA